MRILESKFKEESLPYSVRDSLTGGNVEYFDSKQSALNYIKYEFNNYPYTTEYDLLNDKGKVIGHYKNPEDLLTEDSGATTTADMSLTPILVDKYDKDGNLIVTMESRRK